MTLNGLEILESRMVKFYFRSAGGKTRRDWVNLFRRLPYGINGTAGESELTASNRTFSSPNRKYKMFGEDVRRGDDENDRKPEHTVMMKTSCLSEPTSIAY